MRRKLRDSGFIKLIDAVFDALASPFAWLSSLMRLVPKQWKKWLLPLLVLSLAVFFRQEIIALLKEWYGPRIYVTALPSKKEQLEPYYGQYNLLYEFQLDRSHTASSVRAESDVKALFAQTPAIFLAPFTCNRKDLGTGFYRLTIISQNLGSEKAIDYELMISFTGKESTDSGVRIVDVESDNFQVGYLYQQEAGINPPPCLQARGLEDKAARKKLRKSPLSLTHSTYKQLGLTRDVVMMDGALEAHFFQTVDMVVWVPERTDNFAILYHIDCQNCRWVFRTKSYAQLLSVEQV